jgi:uncharacterized protein
LPLLWRDNAIGWGNVALVDGVLTADLSYANGKPPRDIAFKRALDEERSRMTLFLI